MPDRQEEMTPCNGRLVTDQNAKQQHPVVVDNSRRRRFLFGFRHWMSETTPPTVSGLPAVPEPESVRRVRSFNGPTKGGNLLRRRLRNCRRRKLCQVSSLPPPRLSVAAVDDEQILSGSRLRRRNTGNGSQRHRWPTKPFLGDGQIVDGSACFLARENWPVGKDMPHVTTSNNTNLSPQSSARLPICTPAQPSTVEDSCVNLKPRLGHHQIELRLPEDPKAFGAISGPSSMTSSIESFSEFDFRPETQRHPALPASTPGNRSDDSSLNPPTTARLAVMTPTTVNCRSDRSDDDSLSREIMDTTTANRRRFRMAGRLTGGGATGARSTGADPQIGDEDDDHGVRFKSLVRKHGAAFQVF